MRPRSRIALVLLLGGLVAGGAASAGLLAPAAALEAGAFHVIATYSPLKFVPPKAEGQHLRLGVRPR
ncbi:MAG: hypothetical protein M3003_14580 [Candidatus Dormibacteraeota bacterium]|nr:hypothetical protein [Candidatus Dormibacteraeota bacterium]